MKKNILFFATFVFISTQNLYSQKIFNRIDLGDVEIGVADNRNGVPKNMMGKTFQPFFRIKPTRKATGLDLSLTYHVVTKEHNRRMSVQCGEWPETSFTIQLPKSHKDHT